MTPYSRWESLKKHKLAEHEGFTYNCDMCDAKYKYLDRLKQHESYVHKGIGYECNLCGIIYKDVYKLNLHDSRKIKCPICDVLRRKFKKHNILNHDPSFKN